VREALYKISRAAISADDLEHLYSLIHGILGELMPVDNFFIALYDPSEDMFSYPYYVDQFDAPPAPEKPGRGLTGYVLRSGHMLLATPQVFDDLVEQGEVESVGAPSIDWLGVPLRVEDKIIGVMAAQSYQESVRFGEKEMSIMVFVSTQVAMAIDRKRSEEALRRKLDELTILHGVAVAGVETASEDYLIERTTEIIGSKLFTDNFGVLLLDEASGCLCPHPSYHGLDPGPGKRNIPLGQGITGSVAKTGRSWRVPDASCEPAFMTIDPSMRSELCVPLKVSGRVIGVINAESVRRDAFTETDERLLETVAGQLATTIEKLRLFEKTKCHLERINALHEIDVTLTSSFDLRLTLRVLLQQVVTQLGVDAADVLLLNWRTQTLEYAAGLGFRAAPYPGAYIQMSDGPGGRVILERAPLYITDLNASRDDLSLAMHLVNEGFTAYYGSPLISKGQVKGVLEIFHRRSFTPGQEWLNFLEALATQAAIAVDNASMFDALQRSSQELTVAYDATLEGWAHALELRDRETEGHSQRVTDLTVRLARVMGINDADLVHVRRGALLHDIGKMGVPDSILFKSSDLSEEEWEIMHKHPIYAFEMLHPIPYLRPALDIPYCHHEKWDGSGYPRHLGGEKIPLAARVFAVVDVCDALVSDRPYRKAWTEEDALEYVKSEAGKYFDPQVVSAFINILKERRN
jgi:putative nucleotidyltransferase with HDIG domain